MAVERARHLHPVDPETGEINCIECLERQRILDELNRKYHGALAQIGKLRADKEAEARGHQLWGLAVALWKEWKFATGRTRSNWREDRFWQCEPFLRKDGFVICRWAVWGVAYMPNTKQVGEHLEVYNDWKLCFRDSDTFERYAKRGYRNPEARKLYSLREQGIGPDGEQVDPNLYFAMKKP